jgi:tRNA A58 N-methylase Trm61
MADYALLQGDFIEYGAGKAGLSSFIAEKASPDSTFIVVEREARRLKKDKEIRAFGFEITRITMDIKDLDLGWF